MKSILEFNLPEEEHAFNMSLKGPSLASVIIQLNRSLRDQCKYGHTYKTADEAILKIKEDLNNMLLDHGINNIL